MSNVRIEVLAFCVSIVYFVKLIKKQWNSVYTSNRDIEAIYELRRCI